MLLYGTYVRKFELKKIKKGATVLVLVLVPVPVPVNLLCTTYCTLYHRY